MGVVGFCGSLPSCSLQRRFGPPGAAARSRPPSAEGCSSTSQAHPLGCGLVLSKIDLVRGRRAAASARLRPAIRIRICVLRRLRPERNEKSLGSEIAPPGYPRKLSSSVHSAGCGPIGKKIVAQQWQAGRNSFLRISKDESRPQGAAGRSLRRLRCKCLSVNRTVRTGSLLLSGVVQMLPKSIAQRSAARSRPLGGGLQSRAARKQARPLGCGLVLSKIDLVRDRRAAASPREGPHFASRRSARAGPSQAAARRPATQAFNSQASGPKVLKP